MQHQSVDILYERLCEKDLLLQSMVALHVQTLSRPLPLKWMRGAAADDAPTTNFPNAWTEVPVQSLKRITGLASSNDDRATPLAYIAFFLPLL